MALLNITAASIWRGRQAGMSSQEIASELASRTLTERHLVFNDCIELAGRLRDLTWHGRKPRSTENQYANHREGQHHLTSSIPESMSQQPLSNSVFYRLLNLSFEICGANKEDADKIDILLGHLEITSTKNIDVNFEIHKTDAEILLFKDGEFEAQCDDITGVMPMLHANILMTAYVVSVVKQMGQS